MAARRKPPHPPAPPGAASSTRRPLRLLIAVLAGLTLVAAYVRWRFETRKPDRVAPLLLRVRAQLALEPVLAAEAALRSRPEDPLLRLQLARACEQAGDPAGAAVALSPLFAPQASGSSAPSAEIAARYVIYCAQVGWLAEAARTLRGASPAHDTTPPPHRLTTPSAASATVSPARAQLALAAAYAAHGEAPRAVPLLAAVEREAAGALGADEWLDGAMTWYQCRRPDRASQWARRGVEALAHGAQAGVASPDRGAGARGVLARCLLAAGQPQAALQALPAAAPGAAGDPLEFWRARAALRCPDPALRASGLQRLARMGVDDPPQPVAAFEAGRAYLRSGRPALAASLLSRAARAEYQEVLTDDLLADAYARLGDAARAAWARARVQRFRGQLAAAQHALERSLALDPKSLVAYQDLAQVFLLERQPRQALVLLQRAQKAIPGSLEIALAKADVLNQLDRFADQARELQAAASLVPARAYEPLRNLGKMYYETRQFDRVIPVLERAVKQEVTDAESHRILGLCYALRPENPVYAEKAVEHLLRAAQIAPNDASQWTTAGSVLRRMGFLPEAAACYRHAIDADSAASGPYFSLAQALQRQGRQAETRLLLRLFREKRDIERQHRQWDNRISADRQDAAAHYAMGDLLLRRADPRGAYPYLLIAASLRPQWKQAQSRLADVCALLDYVDLWRESERAAR